MTAYMRALITVLIAVLALPASAQDRRAAVSGDRPVTAQGYQVSVFAKSIGQVEAMALHDPSGDLLVLDSARGRVLRLRDRNKDGISEMKSTWLSGFDRPSGIAVGDGRVFIADARGLWHAPIAGGLTARAPAALLADLTKVKTAPMPRPLALTDEGKTLLAGLSALSERSEEPLPAASIIAVDTQSGRASVWASGLRSVTALSVSQDGKVAAIVQENPPAPDYVAFIEKGGFYGWPYAYGRQTAAPDMGRGDPYKVATMRSPLFTLGVQRAGTGLLLPGSSGDKGLSEISEKIVTIMGERSPNVLTISGAQAVTGGDISKETALLSGFATARGTAWGEPSALVYDGYGGLLVGDRFAQTVWRISVSAPKPEKPVATPEPEPVADALLPPEAEEEPENKKPQKFRSQIGGARPVGEDR